MNPEEEFDHAMRAARNRYRSRVINTWIEKQVSEGKDFRVPEGKVLDVRSITPVKVELKDQPANRCELCKHFGDIHKDDPELYFCLFRHVYVPFGSGCGQFKASADVSPPPVQT